MGPIQSIPEFLSLLRRRGVMIAVIVVLGALGGIIAALNSERVYSSTAVIQVINPVISGEGGATQTTLVRRMQTIEQQLMSRENLLDLARRYDLFQDINLSTSDQVAVLRQSIAIQNIAAAQTGFASDGSLSGLTITVSLGDPELAAAISNELADLLVSQGAASRQESAQAALRFFQQEEERLQESIVALDDQIALFQTENEGLLPGAQILRREEQGRLEESRLGIEREIVQLRSELATLDASSSRMVTQRRIAQLNDEITQREDEAALLEERIDTIRAERARAPDIARAITAMERTMTQLQAQATSAAERRREAELGLRIEDDQQSVRFVLLEAALVPEYAASTGRRKIAMAGVMAGIVLGFGLAFLRELLNPVMRTAKQMERELQLRPVISIPYTRSDAEIRRRRMVWGMGLGLFLIIAFLMLFSLF